MNAEYLDYPLPQPRSTKYILYYSYFPKLRVLRLRRSGRHTPKSIVHQLRRAIGRSKRHRHIAFFGGIE